MFEFESTIVVDDNIEFTLVKKTKVDRWDGCYPIEETITDVIGITYWDKGVTEIVNRFQVPREYREDIQFLFDMCLEDWMQYIQENR